MKREKASIGARFGALLLDGIFINIICVFIFFIDIYLFFLVFPVSSFLYYGICEGSSLSASLGKRLCGLHVVDENGNKLTAGKGFLRSLCKLLSGATLGIGYLIAFFNDDKQAMHDKMAGTYVVKDRGYETIENAPVKPDNYERETIGMSAQIIGISGYYAGKAFYVTEAGVLIGTDETVCNLVFPHGTPGISRTHCKISINPQTRMFILNDMNSSYGTFLGTGVKVPQGQPMALSSGEEFYLASRATSFRVMI